MYGLGKMQHITIQMYDKMHTTEIRRQKNGVYKNK